MFLDFAGERFRPGGLVFAQNIIEVNVFLFVDAAFGELAGEFFTGGSDENGRWLTLDFGSGWIKTDNPGLCFRIPSSGEPGVFADLLIGFGSAGVMMAAIVPVFAVGPDFGGFTVKIAFWVPSREGSQLGKNLFFRQVFDFELDLLFFEAAFFLGFVVELLQRPPEVTGSLESFRRKERVPGTVELKMGNVVFFWSALAQEPEFAASFNDGQSRDMARFFQAFLWRLSR